MTRLAILVALLVVSALSISAPPGQQQAPGKASTGGGGMDLSAEGRARLDAVEKAMKPEPYTPQPTGCKRWKGRAFIARYDARGERSGCIAQCAAALTEASGSTGRWEITGEDCAK